MATTGRRSLGLKFLLVCALVVLMSLPAFVVWGLLSERMNRANQVVAEVGQQFGGEQSMFGPILAVPYRTTTTVQLDDGRSRLETQTGWYVVYAEEGRASAALDTDVRSRSDLFKVRTYAADVAMSAKFDLSKEPSALPENAVADWTRAVLLMGVADTRGAASAAKVTVSGLGDVDLQPGSAYATVIPAGVNGWLMAPVGAIAKPGATFDVATKLTFTGVESFSFGAFAKNTSLRIKGDWGDVGYFGAFPAKFTPAEDSFEAEWTAPFISRGLAAAGPATDMGALSGLTVQARLIDPANPYQAVERSLKYAIMFIGVVFLAYFLFEATNARRVHPAQYILIGLSQLIFYLLLLSISERTGFDIAFVIAATATVALISAYAGSVFQSVRTGLIALIAFTALYGLIYLLMRLEDFALLAGSIVAFIAIAVVMWSTRNLNWYDLSRGEERAAPSRTPPAG